MSNDDVQNENDNNMLHESIEDGNSDKNSSEERINTIISEINELINEMKNSQEIGHGIAQSQSLTSSQGTNSNQEENHGEAPAQSQAPADISAIIVQTAETLTALNTIKTELCKLPLDFCEKVYIENCIAPLEVAMELLSRTSYDLSTSVNILTTSPIVQRKKGELKDTIHTIYSINELVEDLYDVLKKRFKRITKENDCCTFP